MVLHYVLYVIIILLHNNNPPPPIEFHQLIIQQIDLYKDKIDIDINLKYLQKFRHCTIINHCCEEGNLQLVKYFVNHFTTNIIKRKNNKMNKISHHHQTTIQYNQY